MARLKLNSADLLFDNYTEAEEAFKADSDPEWHAVGVYIDRPWRGGVLAYRVERVNRKSYSHEGEGLERIYGPTKIEWRRSHV